MSVVFRIRAAGEPGCRLALCGVVLTAMNGGLSPLAAVVNMNTPAHYLHWHWILISVPNLAVIVLMVVVFALAIGLPFPGERS
jgi:hypothetical protein